jgi:hypothetical protein
VLQLLQSQQCARNPCNGGRDDCEGHMLSLEGSGPKVFEGAVSNARFPRCFRAPDNITKYDGKTTPTSDWRITASPVEQEERTMICSSSSCFLSIWSNPQSLAGPFAEKRHQQLGRSKGGLHRQFLGHIRTPWQPLGPKGLATEAGHAPLGLHLVFFTEMS